ncbi:MAG TPA: SCP2 sterol-binding domain-containing protein [Myxococcota bacterium]|jgi:hypothetical protein|nr:SCP2 sterol-binding domain-containing protein [Myxococcota bacterium]
MAAVVEAKAFFETELPAKYAQGVRDLEARVRKLEARLAGVMAAEAVVRIVLRGEGGGDWTLRLAAGQLRVEATAQSEARLMSLVQSAADFKAAQEGAVSLGFGGADREDKAQPGGPGPAAGLMRFLTGPRIERLRTLAGTLRFVVTSVDGDPERTWSLTLVLGPGEPPDPPDKADCTISVGHADSKLMAEGKLAPPAAFMAGKVKIAGNMGLAMQLGSLMMG